MSIYQTAEGLWVHDSGEEGVRKQQSEYRAVADVFGDEHVAGVWDVGAHVGWFPWYLRQVLPGGFSDAVCVECAPRQLDVLRRNAGAGVKVLAGALVPDDYPYGGVRLFLGNKYSSCDSTYCPVRGRKSVMVRPVKVADVAAVVPRPRLVKLDCEGAEYYVDPRRHLPDSVECLVAEIHYNRKGQLDLAHQFDDACKAAGFCPVKPFKVNGYNRTSHVAYVRRG